MTKSPLLGNFTRSALYNVEGSGWLVDASWRFNPIPRSTLGPMDCREFRRRYSAYRDAHDPELAAEMDDHIEFCSACAGFDRAVREGTDLLRGELLVPSPDFLAQLTLRLATSDPVPEPLPPRVSPWGATIAAGLLIALVSLTLKELMVLPPPVAAEVQPMVIAQPRLVPGIPFIAFERAGEAAVSH